MAQANISENLARRLIFRQRLLRWFYRERRALPWRGETDPYRILVSEIMLQQTRVAVVRERYSRFLKRFPDINRLARAREHTVLAAWSGLGYYRRARSLHAAAREIARRKQFPRTSRELMELPGIGRYTANAVASIAFGEAVPVVDGNVKRVLARFCGRSMDEDQCWQTAGELLDRDRPGDFNQAVMELGALVCLPRTPLCAKCPVEALCASKSAGPRREQQPRNKSMLHYTLMIKGRSVLLEQRPPSASLMPGMWQLPEFSGSAGKVPLPILRLRHSITNTDYSVLVYVAERIRANGRRRRWAALYSTQRLPLTGLARKILQLLKQGLSSAYS